MQFYLNSGFGEMLGEVWLNKIYDLGFAGIRTDILKNWRPVVDELGKFEKLSPIFLFGGGNMSEWSPEYFKDTVVTVAKHIKDNGYFLNRPVYFEIGNEPDIAVREWRENPRRLNDTFWDCYQLAKTTRNDIKVITGGISNLNQRGLDYLDEFMQESIPNNAIVGFHRYSNGVDVSTPHSGFQSRPHEMNRLRAIAGENRLFCTETGLSQGPHKVSKGFPLCWLNNTVWLSEVEQGEAIETEWKFYQKYNIEGMVWYQLRDGLRKSQLLDHYGIHYSDEREKFSCDVVRKIAKPAT